MSRVNENTVVQLPSQIGVPAAARRIEYLPAALLQKICQVENRPNIPPMSTSRRHDIHGQFRVGALLACLHDSQKQHARFTLCGLSKPMHGMRERARLCNLFETLPTVDEAFRR